MTEKMTPLNEKQQRLVEACFTDGSAPLIHRVIREHIIVNETIYGFSYDDLYQEGCIWLCKAAASFCDDKGVKFETYAFKVVANGLRTYCRLMCSKQKRLWPLPSGGDEKEGGFVLEQMASENNRIDDLLSEMDVLNLLYSAKQRYTGTVRLGIEAIEWKVKGFTGKEIADMYGVKPNLVGAWISRASFRLKNDREFMLRFEEIVEKPFP